MYPLPKYCSRQHCEKLWISSKTPCADKACSNQVSQLLLHGVTQTAFTEGDIRICLSLCVFPRPWLAKAALQGTLPLQSLPASVLRFHFLWPKAVSESLAWQVICELGVANPCCKAPGLIYWDYVYTLKYTGQGSGDQVQQHSLYPHSKTFFPL